MAETFENEWTKRIEELEAELKAERERGDRAYRKGVDDGRATQAILEVQGRDKFLFLAGLKLDLKDENARLSKELAEARRVIDKAMQSLNESGIGEVGLIDTIHRTHRILARKEADHER